MIRWVLYLIAVCFVPVIAVSNLKAAEQNSASDYGSSSSQIGLVAEAVNVVKGTIETDTRNIKVSDEVFQQELIQTTSVSATQFIFLDETILTIGPESQLVLDEMVFNPKATKGKVVVTALKGLFTFVSGSLPSDSYQIRTPTATIGVRGTKFDLFVSRNGASTVILRSGAVTVKNLRGDTKRIASINSTTSVITEKTQPTPPVPASPELEQLFKPLSNLQEFRGKNPDKVNVQRENIEKKRVQEKERALKTIIEKSLGEGNQQQIEAREKAEKRKAEKREKAEKRKAEKREKAEKRKAKKREKAEKRAIKKQKRADRKQERAEKRAIKKQERTEKRAIKNKKGRETQI